MQEQKAVLACYFAQWHRWITVAMANNAENEVFMTTFLWTTATHSAHKQTINQASRGGRP